MLDIGSPLEDDHISVRGFLKRALMVHACPSEALVRRKIIARRQRK